MPYNLLLLPLLGGYIFVRKCYRTRYNALRSENYRLLFLAAEFGLYLLIVACILRGLFNLIAHYIPQLHYIDRLWHAVFPFDYSGVAFIAFFLGLTLWRVANRWFDSDEEVDRSIRDKGDPLEVLLKDAMLDSRAVLLTMKNGKVYVGQVAVNFNPAYEIKSVKINPILSGYRKSDDQTVHFNIDYTSLLEKIHNRDPSVSERDKQDLGTVIAVDEIRSVSIFSLPMYKQFFSHP